MNYKNNIITLKAHDGDLSDLYQAFDQCKSRTEKATNERLIHWMSQMSDAYRTCSDGYMMVCNQQDIYDLHQLCNIYISRYGRKNGVINTIWDELSSASVAPEDAMRAAWSSAIPSDHREEQRDGEEEQRDRGRRNQREREEREERDRRELEEQRRVEAERRELNQRAADGLAWDTEAVTGEDANLWVIDDEIDDDDDFDDVVPY